MVDRIISYYFITTSFRFRFFVFGKKGATALLRLMPLIHCVNVAEMHVQRRGGPRQTWILASWRGVSQNCVSESIVATTKWLLSSSLILTVMRIWTRRSLCVNLIVERYKGEC